MNLIASSAEGSLVCVYISLQCAMNIDSALHRVINPKTLAILNQPFYVHSITESYNPYLRADMTSYRME